MPVAAPPKPSAYETFNHAAPAASVAHDLHTSCPGALAYQLLSAMRAQCDRSAAATANDAHGGITAGPSLTLSSMPITRMGPN